jgi:hypothetical protein
MRRTISRAIRVTCFALASAVCVPAAAGPDSGGQSDALTDGLLVVRYATPKDGQCADAKKDGNGQSDALTDGLLILRNNAKDPKHSSASDASAGGGASRANDRLRNAGPVNGAAPASKGLDAGMKQLEGQDKLGNTASTGGGVSVAAGDVTGDSAPQASGLPTGKRQHKPVTMTAPADTAANCP